MSNTYLARTTICLLCVVACANVSAEIRSPIILGNVTDDSDPIGVLLLRFTDAPAAELLAEDGHARGDHRPDVVWKADGAPVAVWAWNNGTEHDIAFSEWTGTTWSGTEFLTTGMDDDLHPRVHVEDDGTVHVVWWTDDVRDRVFLSTRSSGSSTWSTPIEVTQPTESGRRPSVAAHAGVLRVSYERDSATLAQDIVVSRLEGSGTFTPEVLASTDRASELDSVLHAHGGRLWTSWKHGDTDFGCASFADSSWDAMQTIMWDDSTWVGVEGARRQIQRQVMGYP